MAADRLRALLRSLPRPRSVRARAATAAALVMAMVLAVGGAWLYVTLTDNLLDNTQDRTELAARKVAGTTGALPRHLPQPAGGVDAVVVLGPQGQPLAGTGPDPAAGGAAELAGFRPAPGKETSSKVLPTTAASGQRSLAVVVRDESTQGTRYVYALTALADLNDATRALGVTLLVGGPLLMALAAVIAWAVTGLALRPVEAIRAELASVTASALDRRVPDPKGKDEITLLARTVNRTLDRLEQAVSRQRQFTADASHELRNPIAALRTELEVALLATQAPESAAPERQTPESAGSVRKALDAAVRLQRIADDLLLLARLDTQPAPAADPADLALLCAEEIARRRGPRVPLVLDATAPVPVRGDAVQLERLLANLVDNALRHAAGEVRLSAAVEPATGQAVLRVADDGPGIPPEAAEQVFERFARLHAARHRRSGGTGLGLAIARDIARAHGGSLRVEPSARGALLVACFPVRGV
ncbi:HAMP domain-containing protein [Streptomyces sioyaensis]|uniref:histidine kinase n=1 Tax=Streptomyces sioyaensis TaxID=67364 RepID=A0A4Q1QWQ3_9ACTN|nr:ATP-binding protein [Streptomyces sioyaensis]MBM4790831.1 HAMP domain-containing protein [Streptomyces sioyaensis]RXS59789.1 HAMP domain-containing protein [Streptomyces sioyaensis]